MQKSRTVYSTDQGRLCPDCGATTAACRCALQKKELIIKGDGTVRVSRETKGRKGKGVTLITGLPLAEAALLDLTRALKQLCGTGGTLKEHVVEIQGDHREKLVIHLQKLGYRVKLAGG